MIVPILITFFSLVALIIIHELGHFVLAKRFGMRVDEFGVFFPPKLFSKKIGETEYSLNLLPLGAFVRIHGEDGEAREDTGRSFTSKPLWQRMLVVLGGVLAFWVVSFFLLTFVAGTSGLPAAVTDEAENIRDPQVRITQVLEGTHAQEGGLMMLDTIAGLKAEEEEIVPVKVEEVQAFLQARPAEEVTFVLSRGGEVREEVVSTNDEGLVGISLARIGFRVAPWYQAPAVGLEATGRMTYNIVASLWFVASELISGNEVEGADVRGPIGIGAIFVDAFDVGAGYFLYFLALISIYLAIFNILPIPAVDGGRLLFLIIEGIRKKPMNPIIEQRMNATFFIGLLILLVVVSIRDVIRLF